MSAVVMTIAWQLYRAKYRVGMPFHARAFGLCVKEAWHSVKGGKFFTYDTRSQFERGHMYQPL